ncbi:MAG: VOC family protein [Acidimicrobiia bacterium]
MPKLDSASLGAPCWIDLFTSDPDATETFYTSLFGWKVDDPGPDYGGYKNFVKDDSPVGGFMRNDGSTGQPDAWSIYLLTADIQKTVDAAASHGGQVFVAPMQVHALGTMAVMADPGGASIGAWQAAEFPGFGVVAEPGAPAWFELHTREYDAAVQFYQDVFGWDAHTMSDSPEFRYTTLGVEADAKAGIMDAAAFLPDGVPSHWSVYFNVEDVDETLDTIGRLGGSTVTGAQDSPYGRLATAADPTGALFKLQAAIA